jgi:hypothetical protein
MCVWVHSRGADPFLYRLFVPVAENISFFMDNDFVFKYCTVLESRNVVRQF